MYYLSEDDFKTVILADKLDRLMNANPGGLDACVSVAIDEAVSYIQGRYDTQATFLASGDSRNKLLVNSLVDIALYHFHSGYSPLNVPEIRGLRYQAALDLFKGVSRGTRFLDLPLVPVVSGQTGYFLFGSNPPFAYN